MALGWTAGQNVTTGDYIEIGNLGLASDTGVIRIGDPSVNGPTYIAGIRAHSTGINDAVRS